MTYPDSTGATPFIPTGIGTGGGESNPLQWPLPGLIPPPPTTESVKFQVLMANRDRAQAQAKEAELAIESRRLAIETAQVELAEKQLQFRIADYNHRYALTDDAYNRTYVFGSSVGAESVGQCIRRLAYWRRTEEAGEHNPIEIIFASPGGDTVAGFMLYDYIQRMRSEGHYVVTGALGFAASMAAVLLQAGDRRYIGREAWLMVHQGGLRVDGKMSDIRDTTEWANRMTDRMAQILTARSTLTTAELQGRWDRKDWWISSDEALELGFVDEIR